MEDGTPIDDIFENTSSVQFDTNVQKQEYHPEEAPNQVHRQPVPTYKSNPTPSKPPSFDDHQLKIDDSNIFFKAFSTLKTSLIIGFIIAIFQFESIRNLFLSMDGVVKNDVITIYGFFLFFTVGTVLGKIIENL